MRLVLPNVWREARSAARDTHSSQGWLISVSGCSARGGVDPARRVIDISGDGANNQGRAVTVARD
nr:DUF1194 domain-containing protein [Microvirga sp. VF16]